MKRALLLILMIFAVVGCAIYGEDNRLEYGDLNGEAERNVAHSTVVLVEDAKLIEEKNQFIIDYDQIASVNASVFSKANLPLCPNERFSDQMSLGYCSGILVAEQYIATAAHCVVSAIGKPYGRLRKTSFVFGYYMGNDDKVNDRFDADDVYRSAELEHGYTSIPQELWEKLIGLESTKRVHLLRLIEEAYETSKADELVARGKEFDLSEEELKAIVKPYVRNKKDKSRDWALIKLDRKVVGRTPVRISPKGIEDLENVSSAGYPLGIPMKFVRESKVCQKDSGTFGTYLTSAKGDSGSAIFDAETLEIVGIRVAAPVESNDVDESWYNGKKCIKFKRHTINPGVCRNYVIGASVSGLKAVLDEKLKNKQMGE